MPAKSSKPQPRGVGRPRKTPNQVIFTQVKGEIVVDVSWDTKNAFDFGKLLVLLAKGALMEQVFEACNALAEAQSQEDVLAEVEEAFEHTLRHIQEHEKDDDDPVIDPLNVTAHLAHMNEFHNED